MRKMYVMKSVPSKLSDKPAYLCSLIRVLPGCSVDSKGYIFFFWLSAKACQILCKVMRFFAGIRSYSMLSLI